ncbi:TPA: hypothetical protein PXE22_002674 [Mannheimia haemolytica]|nr:hypothetical protein [Mannheimia haemolytica]
MKVKTYEERKKFILSLEDRAYMYPFTPSNENIIDVYSEFAGAKVDRLYRCNLLRNDFKRMYKEKILQRVPLGICSFGSTGEGNPRWVYIYFTKKSPLWKETSLNNTE